MKIYLASDHAGFELKEKIKSFLKEKGYEVVDHGAFELNKDDDYPDFIKEAAKSVSQDVESFGIILGGSGQGEAIVANKFKNIRCALFYSPGSTSGAENTDPFDIIRLAREHNGANMLSLGARFLKEEDALKAVEIFLETSFSNEERHSRRIEKIKLIENG
jgi:ribose 5-phosphate isomerase B